LSWLFYRNNTLRYLILIMVTVISIVLTSVFTEFTNRNLTYKAWVPFNYSYPALYFFVYTYQLIGMGTSGIVNVACESVIFGLLLHICCQLEILEYRLTKMAHSEDILRECVYHHNLIFKLVPYVILLLQNIWITYNINSIFHNNCSLNNIKMIETHTYTGWRFSIKFLWAGRACQAD